MDSLALNFGAMNFSDVASIPFKHMPTEALVAIREEIRKELGRRGVIPFEEGAGFNGGGGLFGRPKRQKDEIALKRRLFGLDPIMAQDWSSLFSGGCDERKFYVYAHVNPLLGPLKKGGEFLLHMPGKPFYIGKGTGNRAWQLNRNEGHGVELKMLKRQGVSDGEIVHVIREGLTEGEALEMESKLIFFFGTKFEAGRKGVLVNLDFPRRPAGCSWSPHVVPEVRA